MSWLSSGHHHQVDLQGGGLPALARVCKLTEVGPVVVKVLRVGNPVAKPRVELETVTERGRPSKVTQTGYNVTL